MPHLILSSFLFICLALLASLPAVETPGSKGGGSVVIQLRGALPLVAQSNIFSPFTSEQTRHGANELLRKAFRRKEGTIILDLSGGFVPSLAAAEEIADTIRRNKGNKQVWCLVENNRDAVAVIAAAADEVVVADAGLLYLSGLSFDIDHYTGLLAKLGVRFKAITSGPQKTAPEPLTAEQPSAEALTEYRTLLNALDAVLVEQSLRDDWNEEQLRALRAVAPQTGALAVQHGFADKTVEPGAFLLDLPQPSTDLDGSGPAPDLNSLPGIMKWWTKLMAGPQQSRHPAMVAVVQLEGTIVDGDGPLDQGMITAEATVDLLQEIADNERIKAVVLRINSGGGSASASDRIFHAVRRLDERKPVVALFDDAAASGGYYIGIGARKILSHHGSITGSIGVFALFPDLSGMRDLMGIHRTTLKSDPRADLFSTNAMSPEREAGVKHLVMDMDQRFRSLVATRRGLEADAVQGLASGRVFTGSDAAKNGLIDAIGTLPDAVLAARTAAGIERPLPLEVYPKAQGLSGMLGLGPVSAAPQWLKVLLANKQLPQIWSWHYLPTPR